MPRLAHARFALSIAALIVLAVAHGFSQDAVGTKRLIQTITAPAIDRGLAPDLAPPPRTAKSIRPAVDGTPRVERTGRFGASYVPGRIIVRFRTGVPSDVRAAAIGQASPTAAISAA